ncbi:GNAT family N-acetyltransferase [Pontibacter akesuensis]|uniref:Ribosomal-protein-alanine N-acetyltransferase n=1 Tax=Pontibacter akesuensis TaxID=388950 RepID=A0A1I7HU21_9BACT|nr:GNAT family protein [Pontibacter akesuensis]GHA63575.1 N-acetyltransferase [Pontibacter akesuensis]SFU64232.1 ribosomal-protein-alanine N-acetyltransferase [Pontibacter akesuensis]
MQHPTLTTERLELRPIQPSDADFILRGLSDERVTRYYAVHYNTAEEVQEQMKFYEDLIRSGTGVWWAFSLKGEGVLIGACGLNELEREHQKAQIGFWLLPGYWGKGYIQEAARAVTKYGFDTLQLNRIEAIVEGGNGQSEKVLQKLGFSYEGRLRESEAKNGAFIDLLYYSMLRREFAAKSPALP